MITLTMPGKMREIHQYVVELFAFAKARLLQHNVMLCLHTVHKSKVNSRALPSCRHALAASDNYACSLTAAQDLLESNVCRLCLHSRIAADCQWAGYTHVNRKRSNAFADVLYSR